MAGNIIVIIIVCLAAFYVGRRIYKISSARRADCGCDSGKGCTAPCDLKEDSEPGLNG